MMSCRSTLNARSMGRPFVGAEDEYGEQDGQDRCGHLRSRRRWLRWVYGSQDGCERRLDLSLTLLEGVNPLIQVPDIRCRVPSRADADRNLSSYRVARSREIRVLPNLLCCWHVFLFSSPRRQALAPPDRQDRAHRDRVIDVFTPDRNVDVPQVRRSATRQSVTAVVAPALHVAVKIDVALELPHRISPRVLLHASLVQPLRVLGNVTEVAGLRRLEREVDGGTKIARAELVGGELDAVVVRVILAHPVAWPVVAGFVGQDATEE